MRSQKAFASLFLIVILSTIMIMCVSYASFAQGTPPPPMLPGGPDQTPVDGGLLALGAAGAGYAIKKLRDHRSNLTDRTEHADE
jgi:hypothetical protein